MMTLLQERASYDSAEVFNTYFPKSFFSFRVSKMPGGLMLTSFGGSMKHTTIFSLTRGWSNLEYKKNMNGSLCKTRFSD